MHFTFYFKALTFNMKRQYMKSSKLPSDRLIIWTVSKLLKDERVSRSRELRTFLYDVADL